MTTLQIELPTELRARLNAEAARVGKPAEVLVREWLAPVPRRANANGRGKCYALRGCSASLPLQCMRLRHSPQRHLQRSKPLSHESADNR